MIEFNKPFIVGETAFHHQGDKNFLIKLIDAAVELKIDAIKFHLLFDLNDYMVRDHQAIDSLSKLCLKEEEWEEIFYYVKKTNLKVIFLCNDVKSLLWVNSLTDDIVLGVEIHATGINDVFLLEKAAEFKNYIFIGTGGSTFDEINFAVSFIKDYKKNQIVLMHGFQNYPTSYSDVLLSKIRSLKNLFNLPIGYADHTDPLDGNNELISCLGISLGANIIEKHFTIVPGEKRIDSQSAVSLEQMRKIKSLAEIIFQTLGENPVAMSAGEMKYGDTGPMKKAIVARERILQNEIITMDKLAYKRTNQSSYIKQNAIHYFQGQRALRNIEADEIIDFTNVEFGFKIGDFTQFANK